MPRTNLRGIAPNHPGAMLREVVIPALAKPKTEIARLLGVSRQALYDVLSERQPITPAMALRIGKLCGNGPELWLAMQRTYDLDIAAKELAGEIEKIPTLHAAA
jgi:antitoxin HigA-1